MTIHGIGTLFFFLFIVALVNILIAHVYFPGRWRKNPALVRIRHRAHAPTCGAVGPNGRRCERHAGTCDDSHDGVYGTGFHSHEDRRNALFTWPAGGWARRRGVDKRERQFSGLMRPEDGWDDFHINQTAKSQHEIPIW